MYLTVEEVCVRLHVGRGTLYQLIGEGRFPAATHRRGTRVLWPTGLVDRHASRTAAPVQSRAFTLSGEVR